MKKNTLIIAVVLLIVSLACNLPGDVTQATQPPQTGNTGGGSSGGSEPAAPTNTAPAATLTAIPTATFVPTNTMVPTNTPISLPCNRAAFIADVTVADDSEVSVNTAFTKTWRLKNVGTCTWTSGYSLVFDSGDQMNGPASKMLTSGTVAPGELVDVSVDLKAPGSAGTYRGNWKLRDAGSVIFALGAANDPFYVQIKAVSAPHVFVPLIPLIPLSILQSLDASLVPGQSGTVTSNGVVLSPGVFNVGDDSSNNSYQVFLSFDISSIPAGATISTAGFTMNDYDTLGDPFGKLGILFAYGVTYANVDASLYYSAYPLGARETWSNTSDLGSLKNNSDLKDYIQSIVGSARAKFRLQFRDHATNGDGIGDVVRFGTGVKLNITYTNP